MDQGASNGVAGFQVPGGESSRESSRELKQVVVVINRVLLSLGMRMPRQLLQELIKDNKPS
jgi:hypothetical protein